MHTRAAHPVTAPLWGSRLFVSLDPDTLPDGRTAQGLEERETLSQEAAAAAARSSAVVKIADNAPAGEPPRAAGLARASLSWRAGVAWCYNACVGLVAFVLLVSLVLGACAAARHPSPSHIRSSTALYLPGSAPQRLRPPPPLRASAPPPPA